MQSESIPPNSTESQAAQLRNLLSSCPFCYASFVGHSYAEIAMTVLGPENNIRVSTMERVLNEEDWNEAVKFQEFDGCNDALIAYAIRCSSRVVGLVVIRNAWELWDSSELIRWKSLTPQSANALNSLITPERWCPMLRESAHGA